MSRRRRIWIGLGLGLLVTVLATDLALTLFVLPNSRIVWRPVPPFGATPYAAQRRWIENQRRQLDAGRPQPGTGTFDARLGWTLRPGAVSEDGTVHVNARGLRGLREYADEKPAGTRRVVACGDSFTLAAEVRDAEAWTAVVEELVRDCEVWNLGVGGYGTDQALLRLRGMETGPIDALLAGLLLENIGRNVNRYRPRWYPRSRTAAAKPRFVLDGAGLRLVEQPYEDRAALVGAVESGTVLTDLLAHEHWTEEHLPPFLAWSSLARLYAASRIYRDRELPRLWSDTDGEPFQVTLRILEALRDEGEKRGTERFLVLIFPIQSDLEGLATRGDRYWSTLTNALKARGIEFLDVAELLRRPWQKRGPDTPPIFTGTHLSPWSNRHVAEAVAAWLGE